MGRVPLAVGIKASSQARTVEHSKHEIVNNRLCCYFEGKVLVLIVFVDMNL